jgi:hypothetical protein
MKHLITYGDDKFKEGKKRIFNQANNTGWFDNVTLYCPNDLDLEFKNKFLNILECPKGGGYYIWKPYIINKHLEKMQDNDFLIFLDAGCSINPKGINRFNEYIDMLNKSDEGCISFYMCPDNPDFIMEKRWTIKEIFEYFNIDINSDLVKSRQSYAGVIILEKNAKSINIVNLWLKAVQDNPLLFTDYYNNKNQNLEFKDSRHDQSILSVICKLNNVIKLDDETFFPPDGNFGGEKSLKYPFWATRIRE